MNKRKNHPLFFTISISLLLAASTSMLSACSDKDDPAPAPEDAPYILKLKSSEKVDFKEIIGEEDIQDITEKETAYFGERIQLACPNELQFNKDSLSIVKANNIIEKYKTKWKDKELFILNASTDTWEYCGEKDGNGKVLLNTGFYLIKSNNIRRTSTAIGQEYSLTSYSDLINGNGKDATFSIIWLKIRYVFE